MEMKEMYRDQEDMRAQHVYMGNQEVLIWDMRTHFGFHLDGYTFHYPLSSQFSTHDPLKGDDDET